MFNITLILFVLIYNKQQAIKYFTADVWGVPNSGMSTVC